MSQPLNSAFAESSSFLDWKVHSSILPCSEHSDSVEAVFISDAVRVVSDCSFLVANEQKS